MKTLGIIGGIAPASTIEYYRMLIATYQQRRPDGSNPPVMINSIDMRTMLRLIAADALDEVSSYLSAEIDRLVQAGADVGLLASNTPHVVFDRLQRSSRIRLISIVEAMFDVANGLNLARVGLLSVRGSRCRAPRTRACSRDVASWWSCLGPHRTHFKRMGALELN